jgi:hypothetical protein
VAELEETPAIAAGWYADYTGEQRMRWWDGSQWTEHVSATGPQPYSVAPARNTVPPETPAGTVFFWIIVLLPLIPLALSFSIDYRSLLQQSISQPRNPLAIYSSPGYLTLVLSSWGILAATVVLAYFDFRRLRATGFERPFHWAWAFLSYVYVIGRSVVVRRRSGRGLAPLFVWIGIYVVSIIISIAQLASAMSAVLGTIQGGVSNT